MDYVQTIEGFQFYWNKKNRRYQVGENGLAIFKCIQDALAYARFTKLQEAK